MSDTKLSALGALTGADSAAGDLFYVDDVSATTSKSITRAELAIGMNATQAEIDTATATNKLLSPAINRISLGTEQAATSGTAKDFTGIPSGTRRIKIMVAGLQTSGTSPIVVQLGDSGGFETTGYLGNCAGINSSGTALPATASTASFYFDRPDGGGATSLRHGVMSLELEDSSDFTWIETFTLSEQTAGQATAFGAGRKATSAELTQVRVTTVGGSDTFTAGVINISYER